MWRPGPTAWSGLCGWAPSTCQRWDSSLSGSSGATAAASSCRSVTPPQASPAAATALDATSWTPSRELSTAYGAPVPTPNSSWISISPTTPRAPTTRPGHVRWRARRTGWPWTSLWANCTERMESQLEQLDPAPAVVLGPKTRRYRGALRYPVVRQLIRFTGVGIVCTLTSLALYALSRPWLGAQPANAAALILTSFMNTALNRRLTFKITERRRMKRDHLNGLIVILVALLITGGSLAVLHWVNPGATVAEELWTTTLSGFAATAVRFTVLRHWIFRRARHREIPCCIPRCAIPYG